MKREAENAPPASAEAAAAAPPAHKRARTDVVAGFEYAADDSSDDGAAAAAAAAAAVSEASQAATWRVRGVACAGRGEWEEAAACLTRAARVRSDDYKLLEMLAQVHIETAKHWDAVRVSELAVAASRRVLGAPYAPALLTLGRAQTNYGEFAMAAATLRTGAVRLAEEGGAGGCCAAEFASSLERAEALLTQWVVHEQEKEKEKEKARHEDNSGQAVREKT